MSDQSNVPHSLPIGRVFQRFATQKTLVEVSVEPEALPPPRREDRAPPNTMPAPIAPHSLPLGKPFERFGGPSRSTQYELIKAGELESFLVGNRRYIVVQSWIDYVARRRAEDEEDRTAGRSAPMRGRA